MNLNIQVALIGALGGLVGGIVTASTAHYLGLESSRQELLQIERRSAYVGWLKARQLGVRAAQLREDDAAQLREDDNAEAEQLYRQFKLEGPQNLARIGVYGDTKVVESVAEWLRVFETTKPCPPAQGWKQDIAVYQSMRASLMKNEKTVSDAELSVVIFGCSEPTENYKTGTPAV